MNDFLVVLGLEGDHLQYHGRLVENASCLLRCLWVSLISRGYGEHGKHHDFSSSQTQDRVYFMAYLSMLRLSNGDKEVLVVDGSRLPSSEAAIKAVLHTAQ